MSNFTLDDFIRESNRIEGIYRAPTKAETEATRVFLNVPINRVAINDLVDLVSVYQPNAKPRFVKGLNVSVGDHIPMRGGPQVQEALCGILDCVNTGFLLPYAAHVQYEYLHPFTDGNGRSGRALWLLIMGGIGRSPLGFLHHFYYQTLQNWQP